MKTYHFFSSTHSDSCYCQNCFRKVINALRLSYTKKTPPLIYRYINKINIEKKCGDPYYLLKHHPKFKWINDNSQTFLQVKFIINGILQFRETRDKKLIDRLRKRVFKNAYVQINVVRQLIYNIFVYTNPKFIPNILGVKNTFVHSFNIH